MISSIMPSLKYSFRSWKLLFKNGGKAMVVAGMAAVCNRKIAYSFLKLETGAKNYA